MHPLEGRLRQAVDPLDTVHGAAPTGRRPAAVLVLFDSRHPALPLLFLERSAHLRHHAGQIGFPGGVAEDGDRSIVATALREAGEEVGLPGDAVEVIGLLPPFLTATSDRWLTPVIALQTMDYVVTPDSFEVARLFTLTLAELITAAHTVHAVDHEGSTRQVHVFEVRGNVVWGVTAAIVAELLERIAAVDTVAGVSGRRDGPRTG